MAWLCWDGYKKPPPAQVTALRGEYVASQDVIMEHIKPEIDKMKDKLATSFRPFSVQNTYMSPRFYSEYLPLASPLPAHCPYLQ